MSPVPPPLLEARALAYGHPGRTLGRGVDLAISHGEIVCVLGPNGGGKTTLFRTLLGFIPVHGGEIRLGESPLARIAPSVRARRVAYVPQAAGGDFAFSVRDMVLMGRTAHLRLLATPGARDCAATEAALAELGIMDLAEKPFTRISGGERQLTLIARALAQEAPLLVMDEPTASLDFGNQALILDEILRLKSNGRSVLFCSHDPNHALRCADRALLLHEGGVLAIGAPGEVVTSAHLTTLYGVAVELLDDGQGGRVCRQRLERRIP